MINVFGVTIYLILMCVALGHCVKPLRCVTKIFGSIIWLGIIIFFIVANYYRFRLQGRLCSMEDDWSYYFVPAAIIANTSNTSNWGVLGLFQRRWITAMYILIALSPIFACIAHCKRRQQMKQQF